MVVFSSLGGQQEISLKAWRGRGDQLIRYLNIKLREMTELSKACATTRMFGSGISILGAIGITAGIVLVPFTGGASAAVVSIVGSGVTFLGGTVNSGTTVYEIRKENAKADEIMNHLQQFLNESQDLLQILSENKLETKRWMETAQESIRKLLPFAAGAIPLSLTGAFSAAFQENPSTSYFSPSNEVETSQVFKYEIGTNNIGNLCAVIAVLGAIYSMLESWKELEINKRIKDGRTTSQFVQQLTVLRDALMTHLLDVTVQEPTPEEIPEEIPGVRRRPVVQEEAQ